jgi:hypothetical protein
MLSIGSAAESQHLAHETLKVGVASHRHLPQQALGSLREIELRIAQDGVAALEAIDLILLELLRSDQGFHLLRQTFSSVERARIAAN